MSKGITGLDGTQIARLVEVVVRDSEIVLAPSILSPLEAVRVTLMYLPPTLPRRRLPTSWVCPSPLSHGRSPWSPGSSPGLWSTC